MSNFSKGNNMNNLRAIDLDMEAFNEVVKNLRNTQKAVADFGKDRPETETRLAQVKVEIQAALDIFDTDAVSKLNTEGKRLVAKLAELPTEKVVAFDTAVNAFKAFMDVAEKRQKTPLTAVTTEVATEVKAA
jgi:uncharacterized FlaG/YvyC family protein